MFGKFTDAAGHSTNRQNSVGPRVPALLFSSGPTAITFRISKAVVFALYRSFGRALAHLLEKTGEVHPRLTHRYSATSVVIPILVFWICASLNHASPTLVSFGHCAIKAVAVSGCPCASHVFDQASTGTSKPRLKVRVHYGDFVAAITDANACSVRAGWCFDNYRTVLKREKPSEFLADEVKSFRHDNIESVVMFSGGHPTPIGARCDSARSFHSRQRT